jgi:limonene-1,2-epoxide hydrolase
MPVEPVRVVLRFIDCINQGDVQGLGRLITDDHQLKVFDEAALVGREANLAAWRGYVESYPAYVIYPHRIAERAGVVAVLGHTTGSHLGLPDEEESQLTLIWLAEVVDGALHSWRLIEDTPDNRQQFRLEGET